MLKTYSETFTVRATECDKYRRMRLDSLFISMQEVGERHAVRLGAGYDAMMSRGLFFVLARIHVRIERMPRVGERVVHTTWPGKTNRFFCPRYHVFTLEDGTPLASAGALWVMLDTVNRRIANAAAVDLPFPDTSDIAVPIDLPMRLPASLAESETLSFTRRPVFSEFDINGHVNNTKYIAWLCDALGSKALCGMHIGDLIAGYEKEITDEEDKQVLIARDGDSFAFRILAGDGTKHFIAGGTLKKEA